MNKHEAWCAFTPDGFPMEGTNGAFAERAAANATDMANKPWTDLEANGFSVRRVLIVEPD